jgi:ATP-dependent Clp protease protease subunit
MTKTARCALSLLALLLLAGPAGALELTNRSVDLIGKVDTKEVREAVKQILELDDISSDPIFLRIDSPGGSVEAGFVLVDTILAVDSPVYAVIESKAYSMAAIIAIFCDRRYMLPHATMMFHEASYGTLGEDPSIRSKVEFNIRYLDRMHREIAQRIGMELHDYRQKIRDGWWMMADEALRAGVVDEVVDKLTYSKLFVEKTEIKTTVTKIQKRQVEPDFPKPRDGQVPAAPEPGRRQ